LRRTRRRLRLFTALVTIIPRAQAPVGSCVNTANWKNAYGATCASYDANFCQHGKARPGSEWAMGPRLGSPELNCCVCGKQPPSSGCVDDPTGFLKNLSQSCASLKMFCNVRVSSLLRSVPSSRLDRVDLKGIPNASLATLCPIACGDVKCRGRSNASARVKQWLAGNSSSAAQLQSAFSALNSSSSKLSSLPHSVQSACPKLTKAYGILRSTRVNSTREFVTACKEYTSKLACYTAVENASTDVTMSIKASCGEGISTIPNCGSTIHLTICQCGLLYCQPGEACTGECDRVVSSSSATTSSRPTGNLLYGIPAGSSLAYSSNLNSDCSAYAAQKLSYDCQIGIPAPCTGVGNSSSLNAVNCCGSAALSKCIGFKTHENCPSDCREGEMACIAMLCAQRHVGVVEVVSTLVVFAVVAILVVVALACLKLRKNGHIGTVDAAPSEMDEFDQSKAIEESGAQPSVDECVNPAAVGC